MPKKFRKVKNRGTKKDSASGTTTPERFQPRHSTYSLKTRTERAFHGSKHLKHLPTQGLKFFQEFRHDRKLFLLPKLNFLLQIKNKKADLEKYRSRLQRFFIQTSKNAPQSIFYIYK